MWDLLRISKPAVASSTDVGCGDGNNGPDVRFAADLRMKDTRLAQITSRIPRTII
jgi:hypothetical protein